MEQNVVIPRGKVAFLECIAALGVWAIHSTKFVAWPAPIISVFQFGQDGLWAFYIMSGLLVWQSFSKSQNVLEYAKKRARRILPLYWIWLTILLGLFLFTHSTLFPQSIFDWIRQYTMMQLVVPSIQPYETATGLYGLGTLSNFLLFYFLVPIFARTVNSFGKAVGLFIVMAFLRLFSLSCMEKLLQNVQAEPGAFVQHCFLSVGIYFAYGVVIFYGLKDNKKALLLFSAIAFLLQYRYSFLHIELASYLGLLVLLVLMCPVSFPLIEKLAETLQPYTFPLFICHLSTMTILSAKNCPTWMILIVPFVLAIGLRFAMNFVEHQFLGKCALGKQKS
jgi:peptidoglycan/LPS O-acetylase OafA/YrhL